LFSSGSLLYSQDVDDHLFEVPGPLDNRLILDYSGTEGAELLEMEFLVLAEDLRIADTLAKAIGKVSAVRAGLARGSLALGPIRQVEAFAAIHTQKRTIVDQR